MKSANQSSKLIIVCGLPGAGKTTHAKRLEATDNAIRFCPDDWMRAMAIDLYDEKTRDKIEAFQWQLGQQLLMHGLTIIIEWGTWGQSEREKLRQEAKALGAMVELHYLHGHVDVLFERIQRRNAETPPIKREQLAEWSRLFQTPTDEEMALYDRVLILEQDGQ